MCLNSVALSSKRLDAASWVPLHGFIIVIIFVNAPSMIRATLFKYLFIAGSRECVQ
jgi:hypothetical protein